MVTKGYTSGYSAWIQMKKENENVMAYKNIGRRVLILHKHGYLAEVNLKDVENLHGRKDYKVTMKGLEYLIPYFQTHPKEINELIKYMQKFEVDKKVIEDLLTNVVRSTIKSVNHFLRLMELPEIVETLSRKHVISIVDSVSVTDTVTSKSAHAMKVSGSKQRARR
jgi:hypothetical protein